MVTSSGRYLIPYSTGYFIMGRMWDGSAWSTVTIADKTGYTISQGDPVLAAYKDKFDAVLSVGYGADAMKPRYVTETSAGVFSSQSTVSNLASGYPTARGFSEALGKEIMVTSFSSGTTFGCQAVERLDGSAYATATSIYSGTEFCNGIGAGFFNDGTPFAVVQIGSGIELRKRLGASWVVAATLRAAGAQVYNAAMIVPASGVANGQAIVTWMEYVSGTGTATNSVYAAPISMQAGAVGARTTLVANETVAIANSFSMKGAFDRLGSMAVVVIQNLSDQTLRMVKYDGANFGTTEFYKPTRLFAYQMAVLFSKCGTPLLLSQSRDGASADLTYETKIEALRAQDFDGVAGN
jgi:hypothetical protein